MSRMMRPGIALLAAGLLLAVAATVALAAGQTFLDGKLRVGDSVDVPGSETVDGDLYVFAGTITIEGAVNGDLVAFGGQIEISGTVKGDVLASAGTISIYGPVGGDVRTGGGRLLLSGPVTEDVLAAGGQVELSSGGSIGGDLITAGGQVTVAGPVAGSIEGRAGTYERSGSVGGSEHVVIGSNDAAVREVFAGNAVLDAIRQLVALVLFGALAIWLVPRLVRSSEGVVRRRPAAALGGGLLTMVGYIAFLIAAILLMVLVAVVLGLLRLGSLLGIELIGTLLAIGVVSFGFVLAVAFIGDLVVAMALGRLLVSGSLASRWQELGLLIAGAVVVVIATSLPYVGGWLKLGVVVVGVGALAVVAWEAWRGRRAPRGGGGEATLTPSMPAG